MYTTILAYFCSTSCTWCTCTTVFWGHNSWNMIWSTTWLKINWGSRTRTSLKSFSSSEIINYPQQNLKDLQNNPWWQYLSNFFIDQGKMSLLAVHKCMVVTGYLTFVLTGLVTTISQQLICNRYNPFPLSCKLSLITEKCKKCALPW